MKESDKNFRNRLDRFCNIDRKGRRKLNVMKILLNANEFLALIIEIIELLEKRQ